VDTILTAPVLSSRRDHRTLTYEQRDRPQDVLFIRTRVPMPWQCANGAAVSQSGSRMGLTVGYMSASRAQQDISRFLMPGYNLQRPYQFNGGPPPAVAGGEL